MPFDPTQLKIAIGALRAAFPELDQDEVLLLDMLEGETELKPVVEKLLAYRREAVRMIPGIDLERGELLIRRQRLEGRMEMVERTLMEILQAANMRKLVTDLQTVSVVRNADSVGIVDVEQLPQGYFKVEKKADKRAIMAALKTGEMIPGAELVQGSEGLRIQTK